MFGSMPHVVTVAKQPKWRLGESGSAGEGHTVPFHWSLPGFVSFEDLEEQGLSGYIL